MPKVSICIPAYNNPGDVERLLESIGKQTYKDIEVLISDDSTDESVSSVVESFRDSGACDADIIYVHNPVPLGHVYNWNAAIKMSHGQYIKIMFSDDWFTFDYSLERLVALLDDHPDADIAFSGSRQVMLDAADASKLQHLKEERKVSVYDRAPEEGYTEHLRDDYRYIFISNQIGAPSDTIYRRKGEPYLFDEKSNWASDNFLYMEILSHNPVFASTDEPLISIGIHSGQYTEGFARRDERVYGDYRLMFVKYGLNNSPMCCRQMISEYIIKWHKGLSEVRSLDLSILLYLRLLIREFFLTAESFLRSRLRNLIGGRG